MPEGSFKLLSIYNAEAVFNVNLNNSSAFNFCVCMALDVYVCGAKRKAVKNETVFPYTRRDKTLGGNEDI